MKSKLAPNYYLHRECDKAIESGDYNKIRKNACHGCGGNRNLFTPIKKSKKRK